MAGPSLVQSKSGTITSGTTLTITLNSPTGAGNCLIVGVGAGQGTTNPTVSGITLGGAAGNFAAGKAVNNNSDEACEIWVDQNCAGGQTSVVITFNAGSGSGQGNAAWVMEWTGIVPASPVDKTNGATTFNASWSSGATGTLTQPSELIVGAVAIFGSSSNTITGPSAPWTNLAQVNAGAAATGAALMVGYQAVTATTTQLYSGTDSGGSAYGAVIVTLKVLTGGLLLIL